MPCRPSSTCTHYPPTGHRTRERTAVYAMPRHAAGRAGLRNAAPPRSRARLPLGALHAPLTRGSARCVPSMAAAARAQSGASRLAPRRRRGGAGPRRQPAGPGPRARGARARASRHARGRARGHYICRGARAPRPPRAYRQTYQWRIGRSVSLSAFSPASALAHRGRHSGKREIILAGRVHGRAFSYCWIGEKGASSALAFSPVPPDPATGESAPWWSWDVCGWRVPGHVRWSCLPGGSSSSTAHYSTQHSTDGMMICRNWQIAITG